MARFSTNSMLSLFVVILSCRFLATECESDRCPPESKYGDGEIVYKWVSLEYDWPSEAVRQEWLDDGRFQINSSMLSGINVFRGDVYVTVPRWVPGVPATLAKVVERNGQHLLQPFPDWNWQTIGDCSALQSVPNIEIDTQRGEMWIIDIGRIHTLRGTLQNICPPKLVIFDLNENTVKHVYEFPPDVVDPEGSYLTDIVVDTTKLYAYISNIGQGEIVMYSYERNMSLSFQGDSTYPEFDVEPRTIKMQNNITITLGYGSSSVDGLALSPDGTELYYSPLGSYHLYQANTSFLELCLDNPRWTGNLDLFKRKVHTRRAQARAMIHGERNLYYGPLGLGSVCKLIEKDGSYSAFAYPSPFSSKRDLVVDCERIFWVDSLAIDESGFLWFTSTRLAEYFKDIADFSGESGPNMFIWKVFINEGSYITPYKPTTTTRIETSPTDPRHFGSDAKRGTYEVENSGVPLSHPYAIQLMIQTILMIVGLLF